LSQSTHNKLSTIVKLALAGQIVSLSTTTSANVTNVTASSAQQNLTLGRHTIANITWRITKVEVSTYTTTCGATVTSSSGQFRAGSSAGPLLSTVNRPVTNTTPCAPYPNPLTSTATESVTIPSTVVYKAQKMGYNNIVYVRSFSDTFSAGSASTTFNIVSSSAGSFSIDYLSLRFDDDTTMRVVEEGGDFHAYVDIRFTGNGLLQGVWEYADPASSAGTPLFTPLRVVRQKLVASRSTRLPSPPLPARRQGVHLVRFRITDPDLLFSDPVIKYFVATKEAIKKQQAPQTIGLLAPFNATMLTPDTVFRWQAVSGAQAYQLELYNKPKPTVTDTLPDIGGLAVDQTQPKISGAPFAGILVRGNTTETTLPGNTRSRVHSGETYYWRLLAVGEEGNVIGISPVREVKIP
jgi:hypothetical protein